MSSELAVTVAHSQSGLSLVIEPDALKVFQAKYGDKAFFVHEVNKEEKLVKFGFSPGAYGGRGRHWVTAGHLSDKLRVTIARLPFKDFVRGKGRLDLKDQHFLVRLPDTTIFNDEPARSPLPASPAGFSLVLATVAGEEMEFHVPLGVAFKTFLDWTHKGYQK